MRVWRAISKRIARGRRLRTRWWENLSFWRGLAIVSSVLSLTLSLLLFYPVGQESGRTYIAVFQGRQDVPLWVVEVDVEGRQGEINVLTFPEIEDRAPMSLGLIPRQGRRHFTFRQAQPWRDVKALAVSVEPAGGSATGQPTGPVVYQAPLLSM